MITSKYALGFTFILRLGEDITRTIKFTCDTGWSTKLEDENKKEGDNSGIDKIDILVAHIGSIKDSELQYNPDETLKANESKNILYKFHLGLVGTAAEISFWNPELVLLSEFGEEMDAIRVSISDNLKSRLNANVLPTDINFRINLNDLNIMCFKTKKYYPYEKIKLYHADGQLYPLDYDSLTHAERHDIHSHLGSSIKVF